MNKQKRNWLLWILLIFLPPFGILYLWIAKKEFSMEKKRNLTIIFTIWFFIAIIAGSKNNATKNNPADTSTKYSQLNENNSAAEKQEHKETAPDDTISENQTESDVTPSETNSSEAVENNTEPQETMPTETEVPHRSGKEIVGVSNKLISDSIVFRDSIPNDVTGNWRLAELAEIIDITEYALSYYQKYFSSDNEIHAVVNYSTNTTTSIHVIGNMLDVSTYEYVEDEQKDAKILFGGMLLSEHFVYLDNGDIEKVQ